MNRKTLNPVPSSLAKLGLKEIKKNLPPGAELRINASAFVGLFREELVEFMNQHQKSRK